MLGRMWRMRNTLPLSVLLQADTTTLEISLAVPQKIGHSITWGPFFIPFLGIYTEDAPEYNKDTCSTIITAALFTIARNWKESYVSQQRNGYRKMWYIYTMKCYSTIKNNEFMKFLSKLMEIENIILSYVSQSQKNTHDMHLLMSRF